MESYGAPVRIQLDHPAPRCHRRGCGFEDAHHSQSGVAIGERRLMTIDAFNEMLQLTSQRLGQIQLRRPHIAGPVPNEHLIGLVTIAIAIAVAMSIPVAVAVAVPIPVAVAVPVPMAAAIAVRRDAFVVNSY